MSGGDGAARNTPRGRKRTVFGAVCVVCGLAAIFVGFLLEEAAAFFCVLGGVIAPVIGFGLMAPTAVDAAERTVERLPRPLRPPAWDHGHVYTVSAVSVLLVAVSGFTALWIGLASDLRARRLDHASSGFTYAFDDSDAFFFVQSGAVAAALVLGVALFAAGSAAQAGFISLLGCGLGVLAGAPAGVVFAFLLTLPPGPGGGIERDPLVDVPWLLLLGGGPAVSLAAVPLKRALARARSRGSRKAR